MEVQKVKKNLTLLQFLDFLLAIPDFAITFHIDQLHVYLIESYALFTSFVDDAVD